MENTFLAPDEAIAFRVRKHWLIIVASGLGFLALALLPLLLEATIGFSLSFLPISINDSATPHVRSFLYALWLLALWVGFFVAWTDYYLDVWQVTDRRIIDIEQKGLFHRDEASLRFENIQDITVNTHGFLATIFGFGDLRVQSAGEYREFIIENATHPEAMKIKIQELQDRAVGRATPRS